MKSLSYHILDLVQNSFNAWADLVQIDIEEDDNNGLFVITISDNGKGMDSETLKKAIDPYYTTRKERKVGLGLPLVKQNAERTGGSFSIESTPGEGTTLKAVFIKNHIDCPARGDLSGTMHQIIVSNEHRDLVYLHNNNGYSFEIDSRKMKEVLDYLPLSHPDVSSYIKEMIDENLRAICDESQLFDNQ